MADVWTTKEHAESYRRGRPHHSASFVDALLKYDRDFFTDRERIPFILDVGCGTGQLTFPLARICDKVIGIDSSAAQIEEAKASLQTATDEQKQRVEFRVGSAFELSDISESAPDVIAAYGLLHHIDHEKFIQKACAALKPGGTLAIFVEDYKGFSGINPEAYKEYRSFFYLLKCKSGKKLSQEAVFSMYRQLEIPLDDPELKETKSEMELTRTELEHLFRSSSYFIQYHQQNPEDAEKLFQEFLQKFWRLVGDEHETVTVEASVLSIFARKIIF